MSVIQKALAKFSGDKRSDNIEYGIIDLLEIEDIDLSVKDAQFPAAHDIGFAYSLRNPVKFACIAKAEKAVSFLNYYKDLVDKAGTKLEVRIFEDMEEAKSWIFQ